MKAKTIKGGTLDEIRLALEKSLEENYAPTLAIVFLPYFMDSAGIRDLFTSHKIAILGNSSFGSFNEEDYDSKSIVCVLFDINPEFFKVRLIESENLNLYDVSCQVGNEGKNNFKNPAFVIISAGLSNDCDNIIIGIHDSAGSKVPLFGGAASAEFNYGRTFIFTNEKSIDQGVIALILDNDFIEVKGLAVGGWEPLGTYHNITKSTGNIVYTIDNIPALDCLLKYTGVDAEKIKEIANPISYFIENDVMFQLELHREGKSPVMRTPLLANYEGNYIVFGGSVPQGSKVIFSLLPGFETTDKLINEYEKFHNTNKKADAVVVFSCCGREMALGPWVEDELSKIGEVWKVPYAGFFTFGEIGPDLHGETDFHNLTCSLMVLSEKNK